MQVGLPLAQALSICLELINVLLDAVGLGVHELKLFVQSIWLGVLLVEVQKVLNLIQKEEGQAQKFVLQFVGLFWKNLFRLHNSTQDVVHHVLAIDKFDGQTDGFVTGRKLLGGEDGHEGVEVVLIDLAFQLLGQGLLDKMKFNEHLPHDVC